MECIPNLARSADSRRCRASLSLPLPREVLELVYPDDPGLVHALCQARLGDDTSDAPMLSRQPADSLPLDKGTAASVQHVGPAHGHKATACPSTVLSTVLSTVPSTVLRDDYGGRICLACPMPADYAACLLRPEDDLTTAETTQEAGPGLGDAVAWTPRLGHGPRQTDAAATPFRPAQTHVTRRAAQLPMAYVRCLSKTRAPLALPLRGRGRDHVFLPDFHTTTPPDDFLRPSQGAMMPPTPMTTPMPTPIHTPTTTPTALPTKAWPDWPSVDSSHIAASHRRGLSIAEFALATGTYQPWHRVAVALHMVAGHLDSSRVESAAAGYVRLARHLDEQARCLGLLPPSAYADGPSTTPSALLAPHARAAFWGQFYALSRFLLTEQVLRVRVVCRSSGNGRRPAAAYDRIPEPALRADTPLTGRPYGPYRVDPDGRTRHRQRPEPWWIFGRVADHEWHAFFAHVSGPVAACVVTPADSEEEDGGSGGSSSRLRVQRVQQPRPVVSAAASSVRWPNVVSQDTMAHARRALQHLHGVLYGSDAHSGGGGAAPSRPDAEAVFPTDKFGELLARVAAFQTLGWRPDDGPPSDLAVHDEQAVYDRTYRHPLQQFSALL